MINAWSLAASVLNGTLDDDYPIMKEDKVKHSDYYYDYTRNNPNAKNPFKNEDDYQKAEKVVGNIDKDLDEIKKSGGFEWTPGSPWPPSEFGIKESYSDDPETYPCREDIPPELWGKPIVYGEDTIENMEDTKMDYKPQKNHQYKYHEEEILKDIEEYVSSTYQGHYTGTKHEFRKVQTIDLMAARDIAAQFCQANILKYGSRYGSKDGRNKKDLLKVIHYAMLLAHFDGHYGEPSMPSGNFDQLP